MDHIGIDVERRESQMYLLVEGGEVIEQRIRTEPEHFACQCANAGTTEPTWPTALGATVADGSVVWTNARAQAVHPDRLQDDLWQRRAGRSVSVERRKHLGRLLGGQRVSAWLRVRRGSVVSALP